MPKLKQDRTVEEWLAHGRNSLVNLPKRGNLYKEINKLLDKLKKHYPQDIDIVEETVASLNETKDDFPITIGRNGKPKSQWTLWVARFNQKKKDAERKKLYIPKACHEQVELLSQRSGYKSPSSHLEQLSSIFSDNGIPQTSDLFSLREVLEPFKDALRALPSTDLHTEDKETDFSLLAIAKAVTEELGRLGIKDYRGLSLINKKRKDAAKYDETIRGQLDEMQQKMELKDDILKKNNAELFDLKRYVKRIEAEKEKLQADLKKGKSNRRASKNTIKPIVMPTRR